MPAANPLAFTLDDEPSPTTRRYQQPATPSWLHLFSAVFAGVFVAGLLLLIGLRFYIHWSVKDSLNQVATEWKRN